jgi:hypothetical protein
MASSLLLDQSTWDLVLDANGNIALAKEPYSLAQDAACAIQCYLGECYWDTTVGVPWSQVLGQALSTAQLKTLLIQAAETVPDVTSAQVFVSSLVGRSLTGQVQVTSAATGEVSVPVPFSVISPQGIG